MRLAQVIYPVQKGLKEARGRHAKRRHAEIGLCFWCLVLGAW